MDNRLKNLEKQREKLYQAIQEVGDFRRGTLSSNFRKCGKKNCICASENHPGHGPQYLWSTTTQGKSRTRNLRLGPELAKYQTENENYKKYQQICSRIIEVNEKICDIRPVVEITEEEELETLKKKLENIFRSKYKKRSIGS